MIIFTVLQIVLIIYLLSSSLFLLVFSVAGKFKTKSGNFEVSEYKRFVIIIPGYKEDTVIVSVIKDALLQNYPAELFRILVIADSFKEKTIEQLSLLNIDILRINPVVSSKAIALKNAFNFLPENTYDLALILDADNIMEPDFLLKMNGLFHSGQKVIQARRRAKNTNTSMSVLDAVNEEINNHIFRKGHKTLGLSSSIIGSGVVFEFSLLKKLVGDMETIFEDKEIDYLLIKNNIHVEYAEHIILWDEKVQDTKSFGRQRRRWMASQMIFLKKYFNLLIQTITEKQSLKWTLKSAEMFLPPRMLLLIISLFFCLITIFINPLYLDILWWGTFISGILAVVLSVPPEYFNLKSLKAALLLPKASFIMFISFLTVNKATKKWVHTRHTGVIDKIDEKSI